MIFSWMMKLFEIDDDEIDDEDNDDNVDVDASGRYSRRGSFSIIMCRVFDPIVKMELM